MTSALGAGYWVNETFFFTYEAGKSKEIIKFMGGYWVNRPSGDTTLPGKGGFFFNKTRHAKGCEKN